MGTSVSAQWCSGRGGCSCECGWASSSTCGHDDGSCCFGCCCGSSPGPSPPGPPSPSGGSAKYCPDPASDFTADYGSPQWSSSGWTIHGGARASSKASYNLAGGFVEFDMDLGGAHGGGNPGNEMKSRGAVLYSSQWTGWVPGSCGGDGNFGASTFSVSNLKIQGSVIHGPEPRRCSGELTGELSNPPLRPAHLPAPAMSEVVV